MRSPVRAAPRDLPLEEEARHVARVRERHEEQVHRARAARGGELEAGQQGDQLAALLEGEGGRVHHLEAHKLLCGVAHEDPPHGTCSKNFMPSLTRSFAPGLSGMSWPCSLMTSSS